MTAVSNPHRLAAHTALRNNGRRRGIWDRLLTAYLQIHIPSSPGVSSLDCYGTPGHSHLEVVGIEDVVVVQAVVLVRRIITAGESLIELLRSSISVPHTDGTADVSRCAVVRVVDLVSHSRLKPPVTAHGQPHTPIRRVVGAKDREVTTPECHVKGVTSPTIVSVQPVVLRYRTVARCEFLREGDDLALVAVANVNGYTQVITGVRVLGSALLFVAVCATELGRAHVARGTGPVVGTLTQA
jgi:hypothetical protein